MSRSWRSPESRQRLHDLLGALGNSVIDVKQFSQYMAEANLDDADIDRYCEEEGGWWPDPPESEGTP
jgi:hypothetical protein